jgi:hypothetical protein
MAKKPNVKTSYSKILNIGYGVLNPIRDTLTGKNFDHSDVSSIDLIRNMYKSFYSANTFLGTGPFIGIVLRNEGPTNKNIADISSWVSGPFSHYIREDADLESTNGSGGGIAKEKVINLPGLLQLRVRIPEIHAALPIPSYLPTLQQRGEEYDIDHRIINQYPVFVAQNSKVSGFTPAPGDLVWVDFQNKNTLEGGIYVGPVNQGDAQNPVAGAGVTTPGGIKSMFNKQACIESGKDNCEVLFPPLDYEDANLSIQPGKPFLPQGFDLNFVKFTDMKLDTSGGKEGTNFSQIGAASYKSFLRSGRNKLVTNRPKFLGYGLATGNQLTSYAGDNIGVHKLVATRLNALNDFWGHFYRAFIDGKFDGVTADNFKYREATKQSPVKPYSERFTVSQGMTERTGFIEISPSNIKKYIENEISQKKPGSKSAINFSKLTYPGMSNHSTGLAVDFGNNGMHPSQATLFGYDKSKKSGIHIPQYASIGWKFMAKYGWLFGFYAYKTESWHWEIKVPRNSWYHAQEFCDSNVSVKKKYRNGFQNVSSNQGNLLTENERNALGQQLINSGRYTDEEIIATLERVEKERISQTNQLAPVTLGDIINNPDIVPDENLRNLYEEELDIVFDYNIPLDMPLPYCVWVRESENENGRREISSFSGARGVVKQYLENSDSAISFPAGGIKVDSQEKKQELLEKIRKASDEFTDPTKNYFSIKYFNQRRIREIDLRQRDTDRRS